MATQIHTLYVRRLVVSTILILQLLLVLPVVFYDATPYTMLELAPGVCLTLQGDPLGRLFAVLICVIWFAVAFFAYEYMNHEGHRERFFGFYLMTLGALMGVCFAGNLVTLYMFYELMTLCSVPLVLHIGTRRAFEAAWRYLAFSVAGAGLGLLGIIMLQDFCVTDLFTPGGVLHPIFAQDNRELLLWVFLIMAIGFGCKAGMFPLHAWLPIAHPVAPAPASAVLSGLITKMGVFALIRVTYFVYGWEFLDGSWVQETVLILALITIFMGSTLALREDTLKKRLAYSTVSQVSYVIFGLMLFTPGAFQGAITQAVFHAIAKNALFMATGAIIYKTHLTQVSQMRGVGTVYSITMWCFTLASLSLIGIPPTGGFLSKWMLAEGALDSSFGTLSYIGIAVLMLSALLTAGYLLPIVTSAFFPGKDFDRRDVVKQQDTWLMWITLILLTAAVVILGMFPGLIEPAVQSVVAPLFT
jgi:multicomponent Na+:H+ antiporter subunit D